MTILQQKKRKKEEDNFNIKHRLGIMAKTKLAIRPHIYLEILTGFDGAVAKLLTNGLVGTGTSSNPEM